MTKKFTCPGCRSTYRTLNEMSPMVPRAMTTNRLTALITKAYNELHQWNDAIVAVLYLGDNDKMVRSCGSCEFYRKKYEDLQDEYIALKEKLK